MIIKGGVRRIIEKNYGGKLRNIVIVSVGPYFNKNANNEICVFFNEDKMHLLDDFAESDMVLIDCTTLCFTNDNHRFYNYIFGKSIRFDVVNYPYYRRLKMGNKMKSMRNKVEFDDDFDYDKMILEGWTNAGLVEAGYVKYKKK